MKKILTWLIIISFVALPASSFAAGEPLSDSQMDEIAAGDWVVINSEAGEEVVDYVHFSNNDINLEDESQTDIQAINNANSVDSADAVQTNIANATEGLIDVNGHNEATLANYNPSEESSTIDTKDVSENYEFSMTHGSTLSVDAIKTCAFTSEESKNETDLSLETLDIIATLTAIGETEGKSEETDYNIAGALDVDYDNQTNYGKSSSSASSMDHSDTLIVSEIEDCAVTETASLTKNESSSTYYRSNKSENNHIDLEDNSQQNLQVISNLNSVGSATAVQTNIANAAGISGIVTHVNIASASNGM